MNFKVKQSPFRAVEFRSFFSFTVFSIAPYVFLNGNGFTAYFSLVLWNSIEFFTS